MKSRSFLGVGLLVLASMILFMPQVGATQIPVCNGSGLLIVEGTLKGNVVTDSYKLLMRDSVVMLVFVVSPPSNSTIGQRIYVNGTSITGFGSQIVGFYVFAWRIPTITYPSK